MAAGKRAGKIALLLLLAALVGAIWLSAHSLGKIKDLSRRVTTNSGVLNRHLRSTEISVGIDIDPFNNGEILKSIQDDWSPDPSRRPRRYSPNILGPAKERGE